jgi:hypothetical protein
MGTAQYPLGKKPTSSPALRMPTSVLLLAAAAAAAAQGAASMAGLLRPTSSKVLCAGTPPAELACPATPEVASTTAHVDGCWCMCDMYAALWLIHAVCTPKHLPAPAVCAYERNAALSKQTTCGCMAVRRVQLGKPLRLLLLLRQTTSWRGAGRLCRWQRHGLPCVRHALWVGKAWSGPPSGDPVSHCSCTHTAYSCRPYCNLAARSCSPAAACCNPSSSLQQQGSCTRAHPTPLRCGSRVCCNQGSTQLRTRRHVPHLLTCNQAVCRASGLLAGTAAPHCCP